MYPSNYGRFTLTLFVACCYYLLRRASLGLPLSGYPYMSSLILIQTPIFFQKECQDLNLELAATSPEFLFTVFRR
jgi:hypothetical protein